MIVGTSPKRPMELPFGFRDWEFVDAGMPRMHQPITIEFPILIPISSKPIAGVIVILVGKTNSNPIIQKGPYLLDQPVVPFSSPLPRQQRYNLLTPIGELGSISPARVHGICKGDLFRISTVPTVLSQPNLLDSGLKSKGRKWWARGHDNLLSYCDSQSVSKEGSPVSR
jgi:hypothetical protein